MTAAIVESDERMRYEMDARLRVLEAAIPNLATKADIAEVRGDIKGWMIATVLAIVGTMSALLFGFFTVVRPSLPVATAQPTAAAQPIIIYAAPPGK